MTKATLSRSAEKLAADIDDIGAELSTDADYDIAGLSMAFLSEYFQKASEILSDVLVNPAFDEKNLAFEKNDVRAALKSRKDSIFNTALDNFNKLFYADAPYSNPVIGKNESISSVSSADIKAWHAYSYNASNILISVSGNIDSQTVKENLEKYFGQIKPGMRFEKPAFAKNEKIHFGDTILKGKFNQAYIFKGFPAPELNGKDFTALKTAGAVLGGRMTSRLFTELREKLGLAYETNAVYPSRVEGSFFAVYIGLDKKNIDLALKKIDEVLSGLCSKEISEKELDDTKAYIKGMYVMDRQTVNRRSYYYAWRELTGHGYKYDDEYLSLVDKIMPKDVYNAVNKVFSQKPLTLVIAPGQNSAGR
jgi:predicted Zn-dependent peptidase